MCWVDKGSIKHIKQVGDKFKVKTFVETGTFLGMNITAHSNNFDNLFSCEIVKEYYNKAIDKIHKYWLKNNIKSTPTILNESSKSFLKWFLKLHKLNPKEYGKYIIYYLDAHFYDPKLPKGKGKFVVLDELKALKKSKNAIIIIHDFDNNLGHITYDGISLDLKLLKKRLLKINKKFKFYTNTLESCDIMKTTDTKDKDMIQNLKYAWSKPDKTYRGLLYCVPKKIKIEGLREI